MTFKHLKLSDSPVMRSLEHIAHAKGWLPAQPIAPELTKTASNNNDFAPSDNLDENLLKLASALRSRNLDAYANAIEDRLINYKVAKTNLYKAFKETGDSFLEEAHPEGDPNLTDTPEGTVEGLITRHKKIVDMINKAPTGKHSNAAINILNQVKLALGQEAPESIAKTTQYLQNAGQLVDSILDIVKENGLVGVDIPGEANDEWGYTFDSGFEVMKENIAKHTNELQSATADQSSQNINLLRAAAIDLEKLLSTKQSIITDKKKVEAISKIAGITNVIISKFNAATWSLSNELEGADFQDRQLDSRQFIVPAQELVTKLHNVKFMTDPKKTPQTEASINKIQAVAMQASRDLNKITETLKTKPTIAFTELVKTLSTTMYLNKITSPEEFTEALKELSDQIFGEIEKLDTARV